MGLERQAGVRFWRDLQWIMFKKLDIVLKTMRASG